MKSPWKTLQPLDHERVYVALASHIPPRSFSSTARWFRGSREVRRQLETADGVIGFSMLARPLRKQYATLSVWTDEEALDAFSRAGRHGDWMSDLADETAATTFVRWAISGADGRPSWAEAFRRLEDGRR